MVHERGYICTVLYCTEGLIPELPFFVSTVSDRPPSEPHYACKQPCKQRHQPNLTLFNP